MSKFSRLSLVHQLSLAAALVSLGIFVTLISVTTYLAQQSALAKTEEELQDQIRSVQHILTLSYSNASAHGTQALTHLKSLLGPLKIGPDTMPSGKHQVPVVRSGDKVLNGNIPMIQTLAQQIGTEPALLLRSGNEFVRVTTLLKDKEGRSMEGSSMPPDSTETRTLLAGNSYLGLVRRNGKHYISAIEPIKDAQGQVIGALSSRVSIDSDMEQLNKTLASIRSGSTGYVYVLEPHKELEKTLMIYHPTFKGKLLSEINNPDLTRIIQEQIQRKQGTMRYLWSRTPGSAEQAEKMVSFATVDNWDWIVATGSFVDEFTAEARALRTQLVMLCSIGGIVLILVLVLVTRNRLAPITQLLAFTQRVGEGDLSVRFPHTPENSRNELDMITRSLDTSTRRIGALIADVIGTATAVKQACNQLRHQSDEVVASSSNQNASAAALAAAIEELSASITHVSGSASLARDITQKAQEHADDGGQQVHLMVNGMNQIASEIEQAAHAVNLLSERSARISNIGKIINDIADQTNLLALNAAIEAARAGESGRGFAVVADEVRKLAERTASSTREISATVSEVQTEANRVVQMIQGVTGGVSQGVDLANNSGIMLETIRNESLRTTSAVNEIANATREQSIASQEVAEGVENIAHMAEQNNRISQRTHEQTSRLEQLAAELEAKAAHFKV